ncbi:MAG: methyltransferase domain-containing protein [Candidatus Obscuribacterales bacterium]|nr:methyltransferase domain-containing protein [Candidatus Obscuribacterales bacterium]
MLPRKREPELMDDPQLNSDSHAEALRGLEALNLISTSADLIWSPIKKLSLEAKRTLRVLDLATGSGDILRGLRKKARQEKLSLQLVGTDISKTAVEIAETEARKVDAQISFMQLDVINEALPQRFDVITTALFTHHLDPPQVVQLLKKMSEAASEMVIVNDLVRSEISYVLVWLASRLFTRSEVVRFDAPISVMASYTIKEMQEMALEAGLTGCTVTFAFPCRMLLVWRRTS